MDEILFGFFLVISFHFEGIFLVLEWYFLERILKNAPFFPHGKIILKFKSNLVYLFSKLARERGRNSYLNVVI